MRVSLSLVVTFMTPASHSSHHHRHLTRLLLRFLVYLLALFLVCMGLWVNDNFGEPSLEQVLYHLQFGMEGLVDTDAQLIHSFIQQALLLPLLLALLVVGFEFVSGYYLSRTLHHPAGWAHSQARRALKVSYWVISHRAPVYVLMSALAYFCVQFSMLAYLHSQFGRDYFSEHYLDPRKVTITARQPLNLVLIYVESLENSYRDPALFGSNLLASLDALNGLRFERFRQAPGTGWTIAGITATQCAVPLKSVSLYNGNDQGHNIKSFLPNAVCLGDILHDFGYRNVYMGGDALSFSGKGRFFLDHHYSEVYGREELKQGRSKADMNFWGLYDDDLFVYARARLQALQREGKPFNLTLTTIDTHGPDGHFSRHCQQRGVTDFPGIVRCTADQVASFVQFMQRKGYLANTRVVILGDHLAMSNPVYKQLDSLQQRTIYNQFIGLPSAQKLREQVLHFDMLPSILEFIGFNVEGGRLGLGYSAIKAPKDVDMPLPEATIFEEMDKDLLNESDTYLQLWKPSVH
ncbi:sulfatase-like hydrolase/transferase [Pseudomethylobacillus aquaticus]|nr:sulfatase-like hydrolase/transferase [Pseudomethylobacillus aquaticus]